MTKACTFAKTADHFGEISGDIDGDPLKIDFKIGFVLTINNFNGGCHVNFSHRSCALQESKAGLSSQELRQLLQWWRIEVAWSFLTPNFHTCWKQLWFWQIAWYWSFSFFALKQVCSLR